MVKSLQANITFFSSPPYKRNNNFINPFFSIMVEEEEEEQANYIDLGGASFRRFGGGIREEIARWFYKSFPTQGLVWARENTSACYYFTGDDDAGEDGFMRKDGKKKGEIMGFKSHSKYHPINARRERGMITSATLPTGNRHCAVFPRSTLGTYLVVTGLNISDENVYVAVVVTMKFSDKIARARQQVYTNLHRALTVLGDQVTIHGTDAELKMKPPHGLNEWVTVWIQWGTSTDPASHVYMATKNSSDDRAFMANHRNGEQLNIGSLPGGGDGFVGSIAAFEVYTSTEHFPSNELRDHIIEDHQKIVAG